MIFILAIVEINQFITLAELKRLKEVLLIKEIKIYKMICDLNDNIIKFHISATNVDLLELILAKNQKIASFKLIK